MLPIYCQFHVLSRNPDVWKKLRAEVDTLEGRLPTFEDLKSLKYLKCVLNEGNHPTCPVPRDCLTTSQFSAFIHLCQQMHVVLKLIRSCPLAVVLHAHPLFSCPRARSSSIPSTLSTVVMTSLDPQPKSLFLNDGAPSPLMVP